MLKIAFTSPCPRSSLPVRIIHAFLDSRSTPVVIWIFIALHSAPSMIGQIPAGGYIPNGVDVKSYLPLLGGPGGGEFKAPCGPNEYLTGVVLRAGDDVDAIQPECANAAGAISGNHPWFGGPGGSPVQLRCPPRTPAVLGLDVVAEGADTVVVNNVRLYCGLPVSNQTLPANPAAVFDGPSAVASKPAFPGDVGGSLISTNQDRQVCPPGQFATGVYGRSGVWLDAMGLICGAPSPAPLHPPSPNPVASIGRVHDSPSPPAGVEAPICVSARSARARNSPAAKTLETQCNAANAQIAGRLAAQNAQISANEKVDLTPGASGVPVSVCDAAQSALNRGAPEAADLSAKCRANGGGQNLLSEADQLAPAGAALAADDPLVSALRDRQPEGPVRHGFDVGIAATSKDTQWGPGKQRILDSLPPAGQEGFKVASSFAMDRNRNPELAAIGASMAASDPAVASARTADPDVRYWLGFDIASALFGDPALGSEGSKSTGPGSQRIQAGLSLPAQRGFIASTKFHLARSY